MKKFLAILMCAVLVLGALAGCSKDKDEAKQQDVGAVEGGNDNAQTPIAAGMLVLNANGALNISYDADGLVLNVEGIDDNGATLAAEYSDFLGKSCSEAVNDLIASSAHSGFLNAEENYVMIKQAVGSVLPGAKFLEEIQLNAQQTLDAIGSTAQLVVLTEENLDEEGYINLESAKQLICAYMAVKTYDVLEGSNEHISGKYNFRVTVGERVEELIVDGVSGDVFEGTLDEVSFEEEEIDETVDTVDPTDEVMQETVPQPTEEIVGDDVVVEDPVTPGVEEEVVE